MDGVNMLQNIYMYVCSIKVSISIPLEYTRHIFNRLHII